MPLVNRLPGTSDKGTLEVEFRRSIEENIQGLLSIYDYSVIETPVVEYSDLFLRKSGGELASRLYSFQDPSGKEVSLRPEFTSSCIRHFIENENDLEVPLRVQYSGPVFRYNPGIGYTEIYQIGAELIGSTSSESDSEILSIALEGSKHFGDESIECRVGHIGILSQILSRIGVSQRGQNFLISNLHLIGDTDQGESAVQDHAKAVGLILDEAGTDDLIKSIQDMEESDAFSLLSELFKDSLTDPLGNRSSDEILLRFISKYSRVEEYNAFTDGISILNKLVETNGEYSDAIRNLRALLSSNGIEETILQPLVDIIESLKARIPEARITVDLGLVRGIAYYTGMVFEISSRVGGNPGMVICGGGRYDGLVKALGGNEDVPALGFAYSMADLSW